MDLIRQLRESGNKLLQTEAKDIQTWQKLKHTKEDLELFLNYNIAEIQFLKKDRTESKIIGTSNIAFVKVFSAKKDEDKAKARYLKSNGMRSRDKNSIEIWDLVENKQKTIGIKSWQILNFISITEENILVLDKLVHELLKNK